MTRILFLMAWIMTQGTQKSEGAECGGVLTAERGVIQTPNFPHKFPVPLRCRWVIDASHQTDPDDSSIVVYFTQLFVSSGLSFEEFDYYEADSTFQLGGRPIHKVTEQNVTSVQWLLTRRHYLVIDFTMDRLEGNHLRVLDGLLDVYGFNFTYETGRAVSNASCSVVGCSLSGHCYASDDFQDYWCDCFPGFSGEDCGHGPLCAEENICQNGAVCRQAGAAAVVCVCPEGFTGPKCETALRNDGCEEEDGCTRQCPEDGLGEPCACGANNMPVSRDRARYEGTVRLTNVSAVRTCLESPSCSLKTLLTKQITKYLRSSNLSVMEDLRVIDVGFSGEVRFHFWGGKRDGSRVRESLNRLVQRGRLGNVTLVPTHLAITQEPTMQLQSVRLNLPKPVVRQGEEFILSCVAQGSSHMVFRWFKDDVLINTTRARRNIWSRLLPLDSAEQYTALLGVEEADPLDAGRYTCQVTDWGYQQCRSLVLEVLQPPLVKLDPMSLTVEKGDNVTVKCTSPNELQYDGRFGYSWTKNNALFKMTPDLEYWEDLHPGGSILRIYNVQKSAVYSCHVHGAARSVSRSVRLELLNRSAVPWCPGAPGGAGGAGGAVRWRRAGPGVTAKEECPPRYQGVATRLCLLVDKDQAAWQTPDYSDCVSDRVAAIAYDFHRVTLGYGNTSAAATLVELLRTMQDRGATYPGEGEPVVALLARIVDYLNTSATGGDVANSTEHLYGVVNSLLLQRNSIIHHQRVEELQAVVTQWARLWGALGGSASAHLALDSLVVDMIRFDGTTSRRGFTVTLPKPALSYPAWYSSRVTLHIESNKKNQNTSSSVAVITYNKLSEFLPQRYSQVLLNGSEVQYEVASTLVSVVYRGAARVTPELALAWSQRPGWELRCGVTLTPSVAWNITLCTAQPQAANVTVCACPALGTYAAIMVKVIDQSEVSQKRSSARIVLVGCVCCLAQSLVAFSLLALRFYRHTTCLLFLKLQCCAATATAMMVFLYATSSTLPQERYAVVSTLLQAAVMVGLSSHLSKVLLIYTEVYLPTVRHLRQTIICIITGVPLLVVLCNHIAQTTTDSPPLSWWLSHGSMVYYTCTAYVIFLLTTFVFLFYLVTKRLRSLTVVKGSDTKKAILRRQGLLNRATVVLSASVIMSVSSFIYVNVPSTRFQYLFSFTSALLGFVILMCYVLHCESPLHLNLLKVLKLDNSFSSESDSSPLNIFTKQEAERECEGAPLTVLDAAPRVVASCMAAPLRNGKAEPVREAPPILKPECCRAPRTPTRPKAVTFHNDLVTGCDRGSADPVDMETYPSSPRKYPPYDPGYPEGTARVCVITSVVVDTPSVVVCSVDVEPCSVLSQSIVHTGLEVPLEAPPVVPPPPELLAPADTPDDEGDVMDRICHDLDYLLGGLPREMKAEIPRPQEPEDTSESAVQGIQQTSL